MERPDPESERGRSWPLGEDALRNLEARLDRASEAAERLVAEAAARVSTRAAPATPDSAAAAHAGDAAQEASSEPPAAGWQVPDGANGSTGSGRDLELLLGLIGSLRDLIPPDLQQRLAEAVRELLLALRALIDWYLERSERRRAQPGEVQDIPIR